MSPSFTQLPVRPAGLAQAAASWLTSCEGQGPGALQRQPEAGPCAQAVPVSRPAGMGELAWAGFVRGVVCRDVQGTACLLRMQEGPARSV